MTTKLEDPTPNISFIIIPVILSTRALSTSGQGGRKRFDASKTQILSKTAWIQREILPASSDKGRGPSKMRKVW